MNADLQPLIRFIKSNIPHITPREETIDQIASTLEELTLEKGEFLVKQGKVGGYFILLEGYLRAYTFTNKGDEVTTYFYPPNRVIFEAASFFGGDPSSENIQAITSCRGYHTSFQKLNEMFHAWPEFREFGRTALVKFLLSGLRPFPGLADRGIGLDPAPVPPLPERILYGSCQARAFHPAGDAAHFVRPPVWSHSAG
jgi:hypothetical protein